MSRLLQTLGHTPSWVFGLFFGLLALGMRQLRHTRVRPLRLALAPLVAGALSLHGVLATFGLRSQPGCAWLFGAGLALAAVLRRPPGAVRYDAGTRTIHIPGSAAPLASMMGIFFTHYALTVALVLQPSLRQQAPLVLVVGALLGGFSGLLAGRALRAARHCWWREGSRAVA